ncbi:MAG: hypothetical protein RL071_3577 [Pseudomonadota bacterium]|jgi:hypothetical protein
MNLLSAWVELGGAAPSSQSVAVVQDQLHRFRGRGHLSVSDHEDMVQDVLLRLMGRRVKLLAKLRATGVAEPALLRALGTASATLDEVEAALARPLDAAGRALLEERQVRTPARVIAVLRASLSHALIDRARGAWSRGRVWLDDRALDLEATQRAGGGRGSAEGQAADAVAAAEQRWLAELTQRSFAAWRAEGAGAYAGQPALVCEDLRLMQRVAKDPDRFSFPDPSYRRRCTRLRAALTDVVGPPEGTPGPLPWPVVRLPSEPELGVYADAFVAEDHLRQRAEAAPVHSRGPRRPRAEE